MYGTATDLHGSCDIRGLTVWLLVMYDEMGCLPNKMFGLPIPDEFLFNSREVRLRDACIETGANGLLNQRMNHWVLVR